MNIDINAIAASAIQEMNESGALHKTISDTIKKTVGDAVRNNLERYSDFGKAVEQEIKKAFNGIELQRLGLEQYNHFILSYIGEAVHEFREKALAVQLKEQLDSILANPPEQIKISEIVAEVVKEARKECSGEDYDEYGEITLNINDTDSMFKYIEIDPEHGKGPRSCKYRFGVFCYSREKPSLMSVTINGEEIEKSALIAKHNGVAKLLIQAQLHKIPIVLDFDDCVTEYDREDAGER